MNFKVVPTFYLKPRIMFVDDSLLFLDSVSNLLCNVISIETSQCPYEVIERLQHDNSLSKCIKNCIEYSDESSSKTAIVNLDFKKLSSDLFAYHLNNEYISVLCVDYRMPGMNGLEVARTLKNLPISRILLTANIGKDVLIEAFDEGIITKIIHKEDMDLINKIEEVAWEQHANIIQTINNTLFNAFADTSLFSPLFHYMPFISHFESVLHLKQIAFSCVYEVGGSMLIVDRDGDMFLMNIYSDSEIKYDLFQSEAYDTQITQPQKSSVEAFKMLVDYKTYSQQNRLNDLTIASVTDQFKSFYLANETYYVCFRPFDESEKNFLLNRCV